MYTAHEVVEQLILDTRHSWEYTKIMPHNGHHNGSTTISGPNGARRHPGQMQGQGAVLYSRHCGGGAFEGSFWYCVQKEVILILANYYRNISFMVDLAQPDSFQLASDFIRMTWDNQQPFRLPIKGPR